MSDCLLHPQTPAAATCEYCGEPYCGSCLRSLLGRRYCPACYGRVEQVAAPAAGAPLPVAGVVAPPSDAAPHLAGRLPPEPRAAAAPRLPGWASALVYLVLFGILEVGLQSVMASVFIGLNARGGGIDPDRLSDPRYVHLLMGPSRMGLPLWFALFLFFGWLTLLVVLIYTGVMARVLERKSLPDLGLRPRWDTVREAVQGLFLAGVLFVSVVGTGVARGWYHVQPWNGGAGALWIALLGGVSLLPFAAVEEVSMRGYLLQSAARSGGRWVGLAFSTLAFAALHCLNPGFSEHPLAFVGLLLAGLYLGSAYLVTGNLWLAIFLHTGWNLMEGPVFGLSVSGIEIPVSILRTRTTGPELWTGGSFGPEAGLLLCLLMALHIAALWALRPWLSARRRSPAATGG